MAPVPLPGSHHSRTGPVRIVGSVLKSHGLDWRFVIRLPAMGHQHGPLETAAHPRPVILLVTANAPATWRLHRRVQCTAPLVPFVSVSVYRLKDPTPAADLLTSLDPEVFQFEP